MVHPTEPGFYILHDGQWLTVREAFDDETFQDINEDIPALTCEDFIMDLSQSCGKIVRAVNETTTALQTCDPIRSNMMTVAKVDRDTGTFYKIVIFGNMIPDNYKPSRTIVSG